MTAVAEMKIGALAPWFGAKRNMAPEIVRELGPHRKFDEPFCGSLAVILAKEAASCETVNDLHGDLINLARVVRVEDLAVDLYGRLARFVLHEGLFHEAAERYRARGYQPAGDEPDVDRAEDFMICSWFGRNGVAGTSSYNQGFCVRYTANGGHAAKRWKSAVESIPAWHHRLREVTMLNRDAFELLDRFDDDDRAVIYVDPPYVEKGAKYIHDFDSEDHRRLAEALKRFSRARVVVSYYEHPVVRDLYDGWTIRPIEVTKSLVNQGQRMRESAPTKAIELLIINGHSLVERSSRLF